MSLDGQDLKQIGERLRKARENAKLTQADAARDTGVARTTLIAIEQGQRKIRMAEIQLLAKLYRTSANALLREEAVHVDLVPRFRKTFRAEDQGVDAAVTLLADLARAEVELENLLGIKRSFNYPPERTILPGDVRQQAEHDAFELRQRLGLGLSPIRDMVTLLEMDLGVRVYVRKLDHTVSGLFAYDETLGACMLLNANHRLSRRNQTAAHETGHLIATRREPEVLLELPDETSREERYADFFGRAFLTPGRAVMQKFSEVTAGASQLSRRHVILLAHFFDVSREAIIKRLEDLKLARDGTWDWFERHGGITDEQEKQVLGDLVSSDAKKNEAERPTTLRLTSLAAEAHRRELLSEGQLSRLLKLDRVELRELFDGIDVEGSEVDGQLQIK